MTKKRRKDIGNQQENHQDKIGKSKSRVLVHRCFTYFMHIHGVNPIRFHSCPSFYHLFDFQSVPGICTHNERQMILNNVPNRALYFSQKDNAVIPCNGGLLRLSAMCRSAGLCQGTAAPFFHAGIAYQSINPQTDRTGKSY